MAAIIRLLILDGAVGLDEEGVHLFAEMEFFHVVDVKAERSVRMVPRAGVEHPFEIAARVAMAVVVHIGVLNRVRDRICRNSI